MKAFNAEASAYVPQVLEAFKDRDGITMSPMFALAVIQQLPYYKHIHTAWSARRDKATPAELLTDEEKFDAQKIALHERAMAGETAATKLWMELYHQDAMGEEFNVVVNVTPHTIPDRAMREILREGIPDLVMDSLRGLNDRMEEDEAPRELRVLYQNFRDALGDWMRVTYKPKDA
jgi:hypothetical protein